ncbi:MAG TPA: hypothetical protein VFP72_08130 [Kineosporiaceae bacterium]|nr:hypothetical protein [Kineosporiaceae bacterium]
MDVPPAGHPVWRQLLTAGIRYQLDFFAAKILLGWLLLKVDSDPSEEMLAECAVSLQHLFAQNAQLPCVQHDLVEILGLSVRAGTPEPVEEVSP